MKNGYDLWIEGSLQNIVETNFVSTENNARLKSPACVYETRVEIKEEHGSYCGTLFGKVPRKFIGSDVRLRYVYKKNSDGTKVFRTELYAENDLIVQGSTRTRW